MTPDTPQPPRTTLSRRETRALIEGAGLIERPQKSGWSVKRTMSTVLAGVGALGLVAAFVVPSLSGFVEPAQATVAKAAPASTFKDTLAEAQVYAVGTDVETPALQGSSYEVYVKPTPTPTPTPEAASSDDGGSSDDSSSDSGSGGSPSPLYSGGGSKEQWMTAAGIPQSDWGYVDYVVKKESGWNPNATNASSGACGLVQALPCSKVPGGGYDPVANLKWADGYAKGRYGSWAGAYSFWISNNWW